LGVGSKKDRPIQMGKMESIVLRKRYHIQYNKDNDYTEEIGIMNKKRNENSYFRFAGSTLHGLQAL
jgi:hypothetical protein